MNILLDSLLFFVSVAMLLGGAELFMENAERSGRHLGISVAALSFIFAGAEPEELFASAIASLKGYPTLAIGNAIGTNITILALCLGLSGVVAPLRTEDPELRKHTIVAILSSLLIIVLYFGGYSRIDGVILLFLYALTLFFVFRGRENDEKEEREGGLKSIILMLLGLALMSLGGDLMVDSAERISDFLGITDTAFGATVLALATSAEMFSLTLLPAIRGLPEIAIGGIMGSVVANNFATLGIAVLISPVDSVPSLELYFIFLLATLGVASLSVKDGRLGRVEGSILFLLYVLFILIHFLYLS